MIREITNTKPATKKITTGRATQIPRLGPATWELPLIVLLSSVDKSATAENIGPESEDSATEREAGVLVQYSTEKGVPVNSIIDDNGVVLTVNNLVLLKHGSESWRWILFQLLPFQMDKK